MLLRGLLMKLFMVLLGGVAVLAVVEHPRDHVLPGSPRRRSPCLPASGTVILLDRALAGSGC